MLFPLSGTAKRTVAFGISAAYSRTTRAVVLFGPALVSAIAPSTGSLLKVSAASAVFVIRRSTVG